MEETYDNISESRGPGKNKRVWSDEENSMLIEVMLEVHNTGKYKADRGFKPGYFLAVERGLKVKLPGHGTKASPHIESRIKTLRSHFNVVYDMLYGANTSGFGWDPVNKCVVAEKPVWDAYLQSHKSAAQFKNRPFPYFDELCIVFGRDRATGKDAEGYMDVEEESTQQQHINLNDDENDNEYEDHNRDSYYNPLDSNDREIDADNEIGSKKKKRRRSRSSDNILEAIKETGEAISNKIGESCERISRALEDHVVVTDKRARVNRILKNLPTLSIHDRNRASRRIGADQDLVDVFLTTDDEDKEAWVISLLADVL